VYGPANKVARRWRQLLPRQRERSVGGERRRSAQLCKRVCLTRGRRRPHRQRERRSLSVLTFGYWSQLQSDIHCAHRLLDDCIAIALTSDSATSSSAASAATTTLSLPLSPWASRWTATCAPARPSGLASTAPCRRACATTRPCSAPASSVRVRAVCVLCVCVWVGVCERRHLHRRRGVSQCVLDITLWSCARVAACRVCVSECVTAAASVPGASTIAPLVCGGVQRKRARCAATGMGRGHAALYLAREEP
jgi:hypothetical protein